MSGVGSSPAGIGQAGFISGITSGSAPVGNLIAVKYDVYSRSTPDYNGLVESMDPIDQRVRLILSTPKGQISSVPDHGIDLTDVATSLRSRLASAANLAVKDALAALISAGQIELNNVTTDVVGTTIVITVDYTNLQTTKTNLIQVTH